MDLWHEMNWYAVQSKPHQENLAAARVAKLEMEVFSPRIRQLQSVCGVKRIVTKSLFTGYFFARFCPSHALDLIRYAQGVLRIVGTGRLLSAIPDEVIASIRERVDADGYVPLERKPFAIGEKVAIEEGPFAGWIGRVAQESDDGRRVLILLDLLQQVRMWVEPESLTRSAELA